MGQAMYFAKILMSFAMRPIALRFPTLAIPGSGAVVSYFRFFYHLLIISIASIVKILNTYIRYKIIVVEGSVTDESLVSRLGVVFMRVIVTRVTHKLSGRIAR